LGDPCKVSPCGKHLSLSHTIPNVSDTIEDMNATKIAKLLSVLLGPQMWLPVLFLATILRSGLTSQQLVILFPSILFLEVVIPLSYLYLAPKMGLATAWDLPKRKERYPFLALVFINNLVSLFLAHQFGTRLLFDLNILLITCLIVLFTITTHWQISLHTALNTFGGILINFLFGWNLLLLYITIPIIFWARLTLNKHSTIQLLTGIVVSGLIALGGLRYLGYL